MQMLPRTLPENLDDLTVQVALVRPGPIQGGAVHPYIERRKRLREDPGYEVPYEHPSLEPVLRGHAGHDRLPGAGDRGGDGAGRLQRRRGGGAAAGDEPQALRGGDRAPTASASSRARSSTGVDASVAERVFEQIQGFSGFGFPKAHSAAFGLLAYQSAWLRVHYGPEFLCSLLNEQPMGFYPPDALVHEAQRRGIEVLGARRQPQRGRLPRRVRRGRRLAVRIGLGYVNGVREEEMEALVAERERGGPYAGIADLASRSGVGPRRRSSGWPGRGRCDALAAARAAATALWRLGRRPRPARRLQAAARSWRCRSSRRRRRELRELGALGDGWSPTTRRPG